MSDENTTPADLAQQAADKAQQAAQDTANGDYTAAGEHLDEAQAKANAADEATDLDALRKQLARYEAENRKLKDENGDRRVKAKQAEEQAATLKKLAQVLGFEPSDEDPEEQIKQAKAAAQEREQERDKLQAELDRMREDNTLRKIAKENGADPDLLVPYLRGSGDLPTWGSDEWDSKAGELVTNTLNTFPQFKAGGAAPRTSGTPDPTNNNDGQILTADDLNRLYAQGKFEVINKAVAEGRIRK